MSKGISPLEQEQTKKLAELGAQLREMREDSLLSLEQMSAKTMIQPRLLLAIEEGHLGKLPEPVYIQGFIKRYANALGADGEAFARTFPITLENPSAQPSWKSSPAAQLRPMHLYAAYVLVIMGAIGALSYLLSLSTFGTATVPTPVITPLPAPPTTGSPAPGTTTASASSSVLSASPSPVSDKPVRAKITLTARSWVRVVVDGKKEFEDVLEEGTQRSWEGTSQITIRAGNAGGVMLSFNESQPKPMGQPGTVEEITLSPGSENQSASLPARSSSSNP